MTDPVEIDAKEDVEVYVSDPEDYLQNQRLKEIHRAKERVRKVREKAAKARTRNDSREAKKSLAAAVSTYGAELLPLIESGENRGMISDEPLTTSIDLIKEFVTHQGRMTNPEWEEAKKKDGAKVTDSGDIVYNEGPKLGPTVKEVKKRSLSTIGVSMVFYQDLVRLQQQLGVGLSVEEDHGPAEI